MYLLESNNVRISVTPRYVNEHSSPKNNVFTWAYTIRIENLDPDISIRLLKRHWKIIDSLGVIQNVKGDGVVGKQPLIKSREAFEYTSSVGLSSNSGVMMGVFTFIDDKKKLFNAEIPTFSLDSPESKEMAN